MKNTEQLQNLSGISRAILVICSILLIWVLFVPLWQIELNAPQYPEGLALKIYPNKIAGNVDIINGLNHYIGMKTLHTEDFIEFTILPYIIIFFAASCLLVAFLKKRKGLTALFIVFILFGIVAMADFWRWEYNYGHDLDPDAAIQVPGMAYQPPLIGYKKLLNFGAYSVPDTGGWLFISVGILLSTAMILQFRKKAKVTSKLNTSAAALLVLVFFSCNTAPQPIKPGVDACSFCKMSIADNRFASEIITKKGKVYKFDDTHCLLEFRKTNTIDTNQVKDIYFINFDEPHEFISSGQAYLIKSDELRSPMGGNIACFPNEQQSKETLKKIKGIPITWQALLNSSR
jgi:copper chaperone NosL